MSSESEWRWADPTGQQRLVREDELRAALASGVIPPNAPVWKRGWGGWKPAHDVPELQTSALAAANGVLPNVPPPPLFVVAAQAELEGHPKAPASQSVEPPPPPRYVPLPPPKPAAAASEPRVQVAKAAPAPSPKPAPVAPKPAPVAASPKPAPVAASPKPAPAPKAPAAKPKPPPVPAKSPPLPVRVAKLSTPAPAILDAAWEDEKATTKSSMPPPLPGTKADPSKKSMPPPLPPQARGEHLPAEPTAKRDVPRELIEPTVKDLPKSMDSAPTLQTQTGALKTVLGVPALPDPRLPPPSGSNERHTLPVAPAPPPLPKLDLPPPSESAPVTAPPPEQIASKYPTLLFGEGDAPAQSKSDAPPIIVPPPERSEVKNAVTRPPPWGEGAASIATIPKNAAPPRVAQESTEELSGSVLLPDPDASSGAHRPIELSSSDLTSEAHMEVVKAAPLAPAERPNTTVIGMAAPPPPAPAPAPTPAPLPAAEPTLPVMRVAAPPPEEPVSEPKRAAVPIPAPSGARTIDLRELARTRPPWFLAASAGVGAVILLGLIGVVIRIAKSGSSSDESVASASASTVSSAPPPTASATPPPTPTPIAAPRPMQCTVSGEPKVLAEKAMVRSGVEVDAFSGKIALGYATGAKAGTVEWVDPNNLASSSTAHLRAGDTIRRVMPLPGTGKAAGAADVDRRGDVLQGRRTMPTHPPLDLGAGDDGLSWAPHGSSKAIKLWALGDGHVEALRGRPLSGGKGVAVAFRQSGAVYFGAFGGSPPAPLGPLVKITGLGPQLGSPVIAVSGDHFMGAWSDRAAKSNPWGLRYVIAKVGDAAPSAHSFDIPSGGLGGQAMSPGVAALPDDRFLLVWTEGAGKDHQVRAVVYGSDGKPQGKPIIVSANGVNAGQGQAAILPDGHGLVAYLASNGKTFEIHATGIVCSAP